jgi:serine/threonine protein phosphatase Stp1
MWFRSCAETDPGAQRSHNEDSYVNRPDLGVWAVADGAGGHQAGEVASALIRDALDSIPDDLPGDELVAEVTVRLQGVHEILRDQAAERGPQTVIASTAAVLLACGGQYVGLWAGDSRIYLLRASKLSCLTEDHSQVQQMVNAGILLPEEAEGHPQAHIITRAVGAGPGPIMFDEIAGDIRTGDRFLICSDGISKTLSHAELANCLLSEDIEVILERLLTSALAKDADDNITAVVLEVID